MDFIRHDELPELRSPVVVAAFAGWNDAADAATTALNVLHWQWDAQELAELDPDEFYDFTQLRPRVSLGDDGLRHLQWPRNVFSYHTAHSGEHDLILFKGIEPHLRWGRYVDGMLQFLQQLGASMLISVGALLADVPHTRPVQITGFATDPALRERLRTMGIERSTYEGPTGIVGVLHDAAMRSHMPSMSLWGAAPHYISAGTNPAVALALLERLSALMDWEVDLDILRHESRRFMEQVDAAVAANPEAAAYLAQLEDATESGSAQTTPLPANDVLLRDLEEFLRQRQEEDGEPDA